MKEDTQYYSVLAKGIRKGDNKAFEQFYGRYKGYVFLKLWGYFSKMQDVEDVFQRVFIKIARSRPKWKTEGELKAWLRLVVKSVAYDEYRSRGRKFENHVDAHQFDTTSVVNIREEETDYSAVLDGALESLSADDKKLVHLVYFEGRKRAEVAVEYGMSYKALESKLSRIRKKMKGHLLRNTK